MKFGVKKLKLSTFGVEENRFHSMISVIHV